MSLYPSRHSTLAPQGVWSLVELPESWFPKRGGLYGHRWCLLPRPKT